VVTNLLINAREAMGRQGCLTVATALAGGRVVMTVSDTGCGMSAEFIRKSLFRPFQTTKKKGLGIGMFQSKLIIEAHRGNLQVQSTPGSGSTFRMFLPITPTPQ
jgi:signal transduction histidine kinase